MNVLQCADATKNNRTNTTNVSKLSSEISVTSVAGKSFFCIVDFVALTDPAFR